MRTLASALASALSGLLLLGPYAAAASSDAHKQSGGGGGVPGLSGGVGNEETLAYLMNLRSFQALPDFPKVYFSADDTIGCDPVHGGELAGTCLPTGNDTTGNGTTRAPYLTMSKCEELMSHGYIECIFDSRDSWDATDEETGNNVYALSSTQGICNDPDQVCIVWSASDPSDPFEIDCQGVFGSTDQLGAPDGNTALFDDGRLSVGGWWAFQNMRVINCQPAPVTAGTEAVDAGDIFMGGTSDAAPAEPSRFLLLNVSTPDINGDSNQRYTSHNNGTGVGEDQAMLVDINPYCHINDWDNSGSGSQKSQCWRNAGNADMIVIGGESSTSDDSAVKSDTDILIQASGGSAAGGVPATNVTVIGHTFRNNTPTSAGTYGHVAVYAQPAANDEVNTTGLLLNTFVGFGATTSDRVYYAGSVGPDDVTNAVYFYGNSMVSSARVFDFFYNDGTTGGVDITGTTDTVTGACNAIDAISTYIFHVRGVNGEPCSFLSVNLTGNIADEATVGNEYRIEDGGVGNDYADAAAFTTGGGAAEHACGDPFTVSVTSDTTPFGTELDSPFCRDSSCWKTCTTPGSWTFPNGGRIPAFVAGERITGFRFNQPRNVGR